MDLEVAELPAPDDREQVQQAEVDGAVGREHQDAARQGFSQSSS